MKSTHFQEKYTLDINFWKSMKMMFLESKPSDSKASSHFDMKSEKIQKSWKWTKKSSKNKLKRFLASKKSSINLRSKETIFWSKFWKNSQSKLRNKW